MYRIPAYQFFLALFALFSNFWRSNTDFDFLNAKNLGIKLITNDPKDPIDMQVYYDKSECSLKEGET